MFFYRQPTFAIDVSVMSARNVASRSRRDSLLLVGFLGVLIHVSITMMKVTHIRDVDVHTNNVDGGVSDANYMLPYYVIETRNKQLREKFTKQNDEGMRSGMEQEESLLSVPSPAVAAAATFTSPNISLDQFIDRSHRITISDNNRRIAFIHVGKSGGSTISVLLRNGCMTAVDGIPCESDRWLKIPNQTEETIASKRILFYLHTPHVDKGNMTGYYQRISSVVVVARDPLERFISAFLARHPRNLDMMRKRNSQTRALAEAMGIEPPVWAKPIWGDGDVEMDQESRAAYLGCYPSVDELALCADPMLETTLRSSRVYTTSIHWTKRGKRYSREVGFNCSETCRDVLTGKNKYILHVRYNYEAYCEFTVVGTHGIIYFACVALFVDYSNFIFSLLSARSSTGNRSLRFKDNQNLGRLDCCE